MGGNGLSQSLTQAGMGQDEIVIHLEQDQLIPQACFALAQRVAPAPDRRHPLTAIEVKPLNQRRVDGPATGCQDLRDGQLGAEHHAVLHPDETPTPVRLHHLRVEQRGQRPPPQLGQWPFGLVPCGLYPGAKMRQDCRPIRFAPSSEQERDAALTSPRVT